MIIMADKIVERIEKDIKLFNESIDGFKCDDKKALHVAELSKMYAKDAKSYLDKNDYYTAFSCISYAHGLLDALKEVYSV